MFLSAPYTLLFDAEKRTIPDWVQRSWGKCTTSCFFETKVENAAVFDALDDRRAVYVSNHASWLDIYALFWVDPLALKIVAKKEIFLIPLCGWVMYIIGHIPFDRKKGGGSAVLKTCETMLDRDCPVFFFPEGTRSKDGTLGPFKPGAFVLARRKNVPVVPITILNTAHLMPPGNEFWKGGFLRKGDVTVIIHDPIYPSTDHNVDAIQDLADRTRAAIAAPLELARAREAQLEAGPPEPQSAV